MRFRWVAAFVALWLALPAVAAAQCSAQNPTACGGTVLDHIQLGTKLSLTPLSAAPLNPQNGDLWSTPSGFYGWANGAQVGPFGTSGGGVSGPGSTISGYVPAWNSTTGAALGAGFPVGTTGNSTILQTTSGGTIAPGVIPAPGTATFGGILGLSSGNTGQFVSYIDTFGVQHLATPAGGGNVSGPGSSTSGHLPSFNGTSGTLLQDSGVAISALGQLGASNAWTSTNTFSALTTHTANLRVNENATTLPAALTGTVFQVGNLDATITRSEVDAFGAAAHVSAVRWDGTNASPTTLQSADAIGSFNVFGYNGTAVVGPQGAFRCFANQNWSVGANGAYCDIATTPNGSTTLTQVLQFQNDGGMTTPGVTGGDKGAGTINAAGIYQGGNALASAAFVATGTSGATIPLLNGTNTWASPQTFGATQNPVSANITPNCVQNGPYCFGAYATYDTHTNGGNSNDRWFGNSVSLVPSGTPTDTWEQNFISTTLTDTGGYSSEINQVHPFFNLTAGSSDSHNIESFESSSQWNGAMTGAFTPYLSSQNIFATGSLSNLIHFNAIVTNFNTAAGSLTSVIGYSYSAPALSVSNPLVQSTVTFTNGQPTIGWATNTLTAGMTVQFTTTGTLPTGFSTATNYYIIATGLSSSQFEVSSTPGGSAITAGSAGSGTQTATLYGAAPTTDYALKFIDPNATTAILGPVNIGSIAVAPSNQMLSVTGLGTGNTYEIFARNGSNAIEFYVEDNGTAFFNGNILVGTAGTTAGQITLASGTTGEFIRMSSGTGAASTTALITVPQNLGNATLAVANQPQTFTGTQTFSGTLNVTGALESGGTAGVSQTCTANQAKTLVFTGGILTGGTCNS